MNRIRTITGVLACLFLTTLCSAAEMKIGFFDFQRVSEETTRGQELQSSLARFRDKKQAEIASKENDLKALRDQFNAQALSLSPEKSSQMQKEIQKKDLELQSIRENAQKEMQIEVNEAQAKFQDQLFKVITALGRDRSYTVIFEKSQAVFAAEAADMTGEVVQRFNEETAKEPAVAAPAEALAAPKGPKPADDKKPAPPKPAAGPKPAGPKPPQGR